MSEDQVCITKIGKGGLRRALGRAVGLLGGGDLLLPKEGDTVLLKPNIGWHNRWETGTTTNPQCVGALIDLIQSRNPRRIIVGESPSIGMKAAEVFEKTGFDELRDKGVELRDLGKDESVRVTIPGDSLLGSVLLPSSYVEADYFVNVPVMKTHVNTCVTISMKNLKGLLPSSEKKRFHFIGLDRCIAELASIVRHDLVLVDGEVGQEGLGPLSGDPVPLGVLVAGTNAPAVDVTCIGIMGAPLAKVKHLQMAGEMGLGPSFERIELLGDPVSSVRRDFLLPPEDMTRAYPGVKIIQGNPCSGCIGALTVSLERMAAAGELDELVRVKGHINVAVGPSAPIPDEPEGEWVIVGKCLREHASRGRYVPGCSPQGWYLRDVIRSLVGLPPLFVDEKLLSPAGGNGKSIEGE